MLGTSYGNESVCVHGSNGDEQLLMTEDHRLTSKDERLRLLESGKQLKEGENRLAGKSKVIGLNFRKYGIWLLVI